MISALCPLSWGRHLTYLSAILSWQRSCDQCVVCSLLPEAASTAAAEAAHSGLMWFTAAATSPLIRQMSLYLQLHTLAARKSDPCWWHPSLRLFNLLKKKNTYFGPIFCVCCLTLSALSQKANMLFISLPHNHLVCHPLQNMSKAPKHRDYHKGQICWFWCFV